MTALAFVLVSVGCSEPEPVAKAYLTPDQYASATEDDFEGPYAKDWAQLLRENPHEEFYEIIKDSELSEEEFMGVRKKVEQCFLDNGIEPVYGEEGPGAPASIYPSNYDELGADSKEYELALGCLSESPFNILSVERKALHSNPDNIDMSPYVEECLVEVGLLKEGDGKHYWEVETKNADEHDLYLQCQDYPFTILNEK
jgi:hypothetical protein